MDDFSPNLSLLNGVHYNCSEMWCTLSAFHACMAAHKIIYDDLLKTVSLCGPAAPLSQAANVWTAPRLKQQTKTKSVPMPNCLSEGVHPIFVC